MSHTLAHEDGHLTVKQGDNFPDPEVTVRDEHDAVVPLDPNDAVSFSLRHSRTRAVVLAGAAAQVVNGVAGLIAYRWQPGDTDVVGTYEGEFHIDPVIGDAFTVPTEGRIVVVVQQKIGA
jgi:hypothetical protein